MYENISSKVEAALAKGFDYCLECDSNEFSFETTTDEKWWIEDWASDVFEGLVDDIIKDTTDYVVESVDFKPLDEGDVYVCTVKVRRDKELHIINLPNGETFRTNNKKASQVIWGILCGEITIDELKEIENEKVKEIVNLFLGWNHIYCDKYYDGYLAMREKLVNEWNMAGKGETFEEYLECYYTEVDSIKIRKNMEKIKNLMIEQINYMFTHNGERDADIANRLSTMIEDFCKDDEDMDKIAEVKETWKDLVMMRYNLTVNELLK